MSSGSSGTHSLRRRRERRVPAAGEGGGPGAHPRCGFRSRAPPRSAAGPQSDSDQGELRAAIGPLLAFARRLRLPAAPRAMPRRMAGRGALGTADMAADGVRAPLDGAPACPHPPILLQLTLGRHGWAGPARSLLDGRHGVCVWRAGGADRGYGTVKGVRMQQQGRAAACPDSVRPGSHAAS